DHSPAITSTPSSKDKLYFTLMARSTASWYILRATYIRTHARNLFSLRHTRRAYLRSYCDESCVESHNPVTLVTKMDRHNRKSYHFFDKCQQWLVVRQ